MQLIQKLLNKFNGLYYHQEFLCLDITSYEPTLFLYWVSGNKVVQNISTHHLFVGYCPVVFCFPASHMIDLSITDNLEIIFSGRQLTANDMFAEKDVIARIYLRKICVQESEHNKYFYYEGVKGEHKFIPELKQKVLQLYNRLYNKRPGNVYLEGNLLKQVQIAYTVPRKISLITVGMENVCNLFPTDLHGEIDADHYVISLRHGGKAAQQVQALGRLLISEVRSEFYKKVYSLGKNHMQELKSKENFPFDDRLSAGLQLPLPEQAVYYRELELISYFDHGIHRIFLLKILNRNPVDDPSSVLAHIHNLCATWRHNKGLTGNYLLR